MAIKFRDNPQTTLPELQRELKLVVAQINDPVIIRDVAIGTASTPSLHGLKGAPRAVVVCPRDLVTWCRAAEPDERRVFLMASADTVADIVVYP